jgi:hypothetical protein
VTSSVPSASTRILESKRSAECFLAASAGPAVATSRTDATNRSRIERMTSAPILPAAGSEPGPALVRSYADPCFVSITDGSVLDRAARLIALDRPSPPVTEFARAIPRLRSDPSMLSALGSAVVLGAVMTFGDFLWAALNIRHRVLNGVVHGAVMCLCLGAAIGIRERRPLAGVLAGPLIGVVAACSFYLMAPWLRMSAMFPAWMVFWILRVSASLDSPASGPWVQPRLAVWCRDPVGCGVLLDLGDLDQPRGPTTSGTSSRGASRSSRVCGAFSGMRPQVTEDTGRDQRGGTEDASYAEDQLTGGDGRTRCSRAY